MKFRIEALLLVAILAFSTSCGKEPAEAPVEGSGSSEAVSSEAVSSSPFREPVPQTKSDLLAAEWKGGKLYLSVNWITS